MAEMESPVLESAAKAGDVRSTHGPVIGSWDQ